MKQKPSIPTHDFMGYFSNGTEGDCYRDQYCDRCVHDVNEGCAVWLAHLTHNYKECNKPDSILHILIPRGKGTKEDPWNHQCKMFIPISGALNPKEVTQKTPLK